MQHLRKLTVKLYMNLPPERKESMATTGRHMLIAALGVMTPDLTLHLPSEKQREVDM